MTNPNNTDPKYWERQLKRYGLSIYQPMTDNSEGEMAESAQTTNHESLYWKASKGHRDMAHLRTTVGGEEGFMYGHQITKVRKMEREIPEWALSNTEVQRILLTAFPRLKRNARQAAKAGVWARLIYLYYRMKQPRQVVARELGIDEKLLNRWIQSINFTQRGLNNAGKPRKKRVVSSPTNL